MTVQAARDAASRRLTQAGIASAAVEADWMLCHVLGVVRADLLLQQHRPVPPEPSAALDALVARRMTREPLQYILGTTEFYGMDFRVEPGVLIPRPETETVVEATLSHLPHVGTPRVLDVGTGSGIIAICLAACAPSAQILAIDVCPHALSLAGRNARHHGSPISLVRADLTSLPFQDRVFDLIVSNPPYVASSDLVTLEPEVRAFEPHLALDGGPRGLNAYTALTGSVRPALAPNGLLVLELPGHDPGPVTTLVKAAGLYPVEHRPDLAGRPRVLIARKPS